VSSVVEQIATFIEETIAANVSGLVKSPNYYNLNQNSGTQNDYIFAVRPASGSPTAGTTRSITIRQDYEVEIAKDYINKQSSKDEGLRAAIFDIHEDAEVIHAALSLRKNSNILIVEPPSFDRPEVNENGKFVSITFTYPVIYRKGVS
jgi:hypothetical protein